MTYPVPAIPSRRSQRWEAVAYWAAEVTPPGPDDDFGMPRWLFHDLAIIAYQDRMKAALRAVREQAVLRLVALWPLLARAARSPWDLLRGILEARGALPLLPDLPTRSGPGKAAHWLEVCPRGFRESGAVAVSVPFRVASFPLDRTGGAVIGP